MLSILMTAVLSSALGQSADNPFENNLNMLSPQVPMNMQGARNASGAYGYGGGYPAAGYYGGNPGGYGGGYPTGGVTANFGNAGGGNVGGCALTMQGRGPSCGQGVYLGCGTTIGPWPQQQFCQAPMGCQMPPMMMPQQFAPSTSLAPLSIAQSALQEKERERESREVNRRLEELKIILDRMVDSLKVMEQRVVAGEKASQSAEARIKWLEEESKRRWLLLDIEAQLDIRMKPIEETLRRMSVRFEQFKKTEGKQFSQEEGSLDQIGQKLDQHQQLFKKDVETLSKQLKKLAEHFGEEKALRMKIEERLKSIEKGEKGNVPPPAKEEMKKDEPNKDDSKKDKQIDEEPRNDQPKEGSMVRPRFGPSVKAAAVSQSHPGVPADKAMVIVTLPANAKLYLNGRLTRSEGTVRSFLTPTLEPGASFTYTLRMELLQNGEVIAQTREVSFRGGIQVLVNFDGPRSIVQTVQAK